MIRSSPSWVEHGAPKTRIAAAPVGLGAGVWGCSHHVTVRASCARLFALAGGSPWVAVAGEAAGHKAGGLAGGPAGAANLLKEHISTWGVGVWITSYGVFPWGASCALS